MPVVPVAPDDLSAPQPPTAGASQCANRLSPVAKNAPAPTEPTAKMIIGTVITGGDSCG